MASDLSFVEYVRDQMHGAGAVTFRKMFGEYALYLDGKVVALVCDDQLHLKSTEAGRASLGDVILACPYPGAKEHFLLADELDDPERLHAALLVTAKALPAPKPKKKKKRTV